MSIFSSHRLKSYCGFFSLLGLFDFKLKKKKVFWRGEIRQKHLQLGNQKEHEEVGWVVECVETNSWNPAAVVGMLLKAIPPETEQGGRLLSNCMMHWNVELIRQANWLNICSCLIIILKWAYCLCMLGMPQCLLAFLIEAHCGVYISAIFNCTEIQAMRFKVKYSNFFSFSRLNCFEGKG